ncbi:hypothetical protein niasHS_002930 [Heterodera schachtii]|uniref:Uncharacterized protein n=1 Tax=Heterodera schachtii TaxID=97005 RepID=A0ABD2K9X0_HETSC
MPITPPPPAAEQQHQRRRDSSPIRSAISSTFLADHSRRSLNSMLNSISSISRNRSGSASNASTPRPTISKRNEQLSDDGTTARPLNLTNCNKKCEAAESIIERLSYLGCSKMGDPTSESEMLGIVAAMNAEKAHDAVSVTLVIPHGPTGIVRLLETGKECPAEICSFPIQRIRFCARGKPETSESSCFALSFTQLAGKNATLHQCHVFRCVFPEETARALFCFAQAFNRRQQQSIGGAASSKSPSPSTPVQFQLPPSTEQCGTSEELFEFETLIEIKERDARKGQEHGFSVCPMERNCFKMRRDREKRVVIMLRQTAGPRHLRVKKCFGLLLAAGRNMRQSDMHLLELKSAGEGQQNRFVFIAEARWNPSDHNFEVLNTETPRDTRVFMTIAIDVILDTLSESIRFNVECKARIFQQFERFWSTQHRALSERYTLLLQKMHMDEQASTSSADSGIFVQQNQQQNFAGGMPSLTAPSGDKNACKVIRFESATERERLMDREKSPSSREMPTQLIHPADDDESDSDEPLLSGSGEVSRECSEDRLAAWRQLVDQWKMEPDKRPPGLNALIYDGCPDVLRGEVWPLLARVDSDSSDLVQTYQMLLEKECPQDAVILRDIHRTFPAHEYYKESNEVGQKSLYRISKAYSLYDEEVGYCQGLSFLAASLLLHMPEERAFCVLVRIMFDYGLRELFKTGFDALHLRFHQLQRLVEDYVHDLFSHFYQMGIETHMYASQWFLTLFTAKFPLQMVFFIVDLFLTEGINTIFHISLALLQDSKKELLQSDFEGVLKFFRVNLPRKYRTEASAKELIHAAVMLKISHKRLAKYEKEWHEMKRREIESQDPLERLERENCRLKEQIMRLERENDDLAHELVTSKIELRHKLDTTEDQLESAMSQMVKKNRECEEVAERERQLREQSEQVKQRCRHEVGRLEEELRRAQGVNQEYKRICTELGLTVDEQKRKMNEQQKAVKMRTASCERCADALRELWPSPPSPPPVIDGSSSSATTAAASALAAATNGDHRRESAAPSPSPSGGGRPGSSGSGGGGGESGGTNSPTHNGSRATALHVMELVERLEEREQHIRQVELELAQTKLALVESQCQNQDLTHQMSTSMHQLQNNGVDNSATDTKPAWLKKTLSSIKEAQSALSSHHRSISNASMTSSTTADQQTK